MPVRQEHVTWHFCEAANKAHQPCVPREYKAARDQDTHFKTAENVCASRAMQITVFSFMTEKQIYYLFY